MSFPDGSTGSCPRLPRPPADTPREPARHTGINHPSRQATSTILESESPSPGYRARLIRLEISNASDNC